MVNWDEACNRCEVLPSWMVICPFSPFRGKLRSAVLEMVRGGDPMIARRYDEGEEDLREVAEGCPLLEEAPLPLVEFGGVEW